MPDLSVLTKQLGLAGGQRSYLFWFWVWELCLLFFKSLLFPLSYAVIWICKKKKISITHQLACTMWDSDFESALKSLEMWGQKWWGRGALDTSGSHNGSMMGSRRLQVSLGGHRPAKGSGVPAGTKRNLRGILINVAKWTPHPWQHYWGAPRPKAVSPGCQSTPSPRLPFKASLSRMPLSAHFHWFH